MSLSKINNFANDDTDILAVQTTVDALHQNSYSLTEYDSTTVPAIAAGSKIEVNGSLYRAESEEAISTTDPVTSSTVADGTIYICMIPSGDASTCTAAFTATAPTWSDSKQGWYGTGDQANYKYIGGCYLDSGSYTGKYYINKIYGNQKIPQRIQEYIATEETTTSASNVDFTNDFSVQMPVVAGENIMVLFRIDCKHSTGGASARYILVFTGDCAGYTQDQTLISTSVSYNQSTVSTSYVTLGLNLNILITESGTFSVKTQKMVVSGIGTGSYANRYLEVIKIN